MNFLSLQPGSVSKFPPSCVSFAISSSRLDPPGQAISTATQELLRLAEANPGSIATLDPVNDLQLKGVDVVEASLRRRVLQDSLKDFNCIHSPTFAEQVCVYVFRRGSLKRIFTFTILSANKQQTFT